MELPTRKGRKAAGLNQGEGLWEGEWRQQHSKAGTQPGDLEQKGSCTAAGGIICLIDIEKGQSLESH